MNEGKSLPIGDKLVTFQTNLVNFRTMHWRHGAILVPKRKFLFGTNITITTPNLAQPLSLP